MIPTTAFTLFALIMLAGSRYEQLQGDILEEKNRLLSDISEKQAEIVDKYELLLKEYKNDNSNNK